MYYKKSLLTYVLVPYRLLSWRKRDNCEKKISKVITTKNNENIIEVINTFKTLKIKLIIKHDRNVLYDHV